MEAQTLEDLSVAAVSASAEQGRRVAEEPRRRVACDVPEAAVRRDLNPGENGVLVEREPNLVVFVAGRVVPARSTRYYVEVFRRGGSRHRRGHDVDIPWRRRRLK